MNILLPSQLELLNLEIENCHNQLLELQDEVKLNSVKGVSFNHFDLSEEALVCEKFLFVQQQLKLLHSLQTSCSLQTEYDEEKIGVGTMFSATTLYRGAEREKRELITYDCCFVDCMLPMEEECQKGDQGEKLHYVVADSPMGKECYNKKTGQTFVYRLPNGTFAITMINHIYTLEELKKQQPEKKKK